MRSAAANHPNAGAYDILHWNSIEPAGDSVIASFRHLDAVYEIDKATGGIFSYRGEPVPPGAVSAAELRDAMDPTYGSG